MQIYEKERDEIEIEINRKTQIDIHMLYITYISYIQEIQFIQRYKEKNILVYPPYMLHKPTNLKRQVIISVGEIVK